MDRFSSDNTILDIDEIIRLALKAKNGEKFRRLWFLSYVRLDCGIAVIG